LATPLQGHVAWSDRDHQKLTKGEPEKGGWEAHTPPNPRVVN
jgi:hypothetical protein